jgi:succinyl-diaminopimelate desuccinylase
MNEYSEILKHINTMELIAFTQDLIKINSVFDPEIEGANESEVAGYIFDFLKKQGFEVHKQEVVQGRPNIIAILEGNSPGKTILFEGHTDVVTAGNPEDWKFDPFGGMIDQGRIYGRGSCDTKGNVAAAIFAVKAIHDAQVSFDGKIMLCIPCDEEGMMIGIKDFIAKGWADHVDGAVICEPEENQLCIFQKGAMRVEIRVTGKQSHGAMPLAGINPNWRLAKIIIELEKLEAQEKQRVGLHTHLGLPSITPTIIRSPNKGEAQINVVPGEAFMTLDIRTTPGQDHDGIKKHIQEIFETLSLSDPDFDASFRVIEERPWTQTAKQDPIVKAVAKAYTEITRKQPVYNGVPGATDGTFLSVLKGIPVIVTGAGDRAIPHQVNEYVEIAQLIETCSIYALAALNFLNEA